MASTAPHYFAIPGEDETDWATFLAQIALVFGGTFAHEGGQLQVTNVKNRVEISKVAITGGPELPGAHLKIMDGAMVVDSWVSGSTPHVLEGVLVGGTDTHLLLTDISALGVSGADAHRAGASSVSLPAAPARP